jgi:23S rRNA (uracil1939-C5)-methyltransferase
LYSKALEYASLSNEELVLDAYCGVGTIGLCAAEKTKHVIGVEIVSDAIENAKQNAKINKIENAEFICKDAKEFIKTSDLNFDVIFVDPPRKGCDKEFLETIGLTMNRETNFSIMPWILDEY